MAREGEALGLDPDRALAGDGGDRRGDVGQQVAPPDDDLDAARLLARR